MRRPIPDAPGGKPVGRTQAGKTRDSGFGRKDHTGNRFVQRRAQVVRHQKGGQHDPCRGPEPCAQRLGETVALRGGASQKEGRQHRLAGLSGHGVGVTCAGMG